MDGPSAVPKVNKGGRTNVRKTRALPKRVKDLSKEELLLTLKKKRECNAQALKIVEGLLEVQISERWFMESLQYINQCHYQDAVEERAIAKLCGYPLCSNSLKNIPAQQFRISTRQNKVFDITERKNFCSNYCFRSSNFIKDQMLTSPLWMRDVEIIPQFKLLPPNQACGGTGHEVDVGLQRVAKEEVSKIKEEEGSEPPSENLIKAINSLESAVNLPRGTSSSVPRVQTKFKLERKLQTNIKETQVEELSNIVTTSLENEATSCDLSVEDSSKAGLKCKSPISALPSEFSSIDTHKKSAQQINCNTSKSPEVDDNVKGVSNSHAVKKEIPENNLKAVNNSHAVEEEKPDKNYPMSKEECKVPLSGTEMIEVECLNGQASQDSSDETGNGIAKHNILTIKSDHKNKFNKDLMCDKEREDDNLSTHNLNAQNDVAEENILMMKSNDANKFNKDLTCDKEIRDKNLGAHDSNALHKRNESNDLCKTEVPSTESGTKGKKEKLVRKPEGSLKSHRQGSASKARWKHQTTETGHVMPIVSHVEKCVYDWFTMDSMCFLFGESRFKEMLEEKGKNMKEHYQALDSLTWDPEKHARFLSICKRLNLFDIEDSNYDDQVIKENHKAQRRPLPDFQALKDQAEKMELKVRAFYQGQMEQEERRVTFAEDTKDSALKDNIKEAAPPGLPLVHIHAQRALRRRIVLDGLNKVLPDFLRTFGLQSSELSSMVRGLVGTFALSAKNITFKPQEWSLLGLIVIKLLAMREPRVQFSLSTEQSRKYLTLLLMSYNLEPAYLDRLLVWLTDVDLLLSKQQTQDPGD